ncbi:outer membrane protein assembly factor BamD [Spirosoma linguale]|uniref:Tetratricopeptide repeat protein n=1 Tax=Spirosoma linguale (strain ATCC 33905 / DSM 74 / LMG 10896 / Claus 1) TaxID=504472 RepID=D2QQM8_SPILD|nr:hypothetical protein Slin_4831 [Spirosoma linguale DSM 74]
MKHLVHACFLYLLLLGSSSFAQTTDQKAQSAYLTANDAYEKGNYMEAANYLKQARDLLGKTNTKIQYLLVKALMDAMDYLAADAELKTYFEVTPETLRDDRYNEMVKNVVFVEQKRKQQEDEKERIFREQEQNRLQQTKQAELTRLRTIYDSKLRISDLKLKIPQNQRRVSGKTVKGVVMTFVTVGFAYYFLSSGTSKDNNLSKNDGTLDAVVGSIGTSLFLLCTISSFHNAKRLRRETRELRQELDGLEGSDNQKQISFTPFYTPHLQTAGLAFRMRF